MSAGVELGGAAVAFSALAAGEAGASEEGDGADDAAAETLADDPATDDAAPDDEALVEAVLATEPDEMLAATFFKAPAPPLIALRSKLATSVSSIFSHGI